MSNEQIKQKKAGNAISTIVLVAACFLILLISILFATSTKKDKSIFGYRWYNILTESMTPTANKGDLTIVNTKDRDFKVGDIITFEMQGYTITHRISTIDEENGIIRTKGDANISEDSFELTDNNIVGKSEFIIPELGSIIDYFKNNWLWCILICVAIIMMITIIKKTYNLGKTTKNGCD